MVTILTTIYSSQNKFVQYSSGPLKKQTKYIVPITNATHFNSKTVQNLNYFSNFVQFLNGGPNQFYVRFIQFGFQVIRYSNARSSWKLMLTVQWLSEYQASPDIECLFVPKSEMVWH